MLNEFGECEIVERRRRRRGRGCSCTTSTATTRRSRSRCRAWPTSPTTPTPVGVFRDVERPTLRGRGAAPARRAASERQGPGDLAALLGPAPPGTSTEPPRRGSGTRRQSSRLRNTMPVRGFGAKNVVFSGMRSAGDARRPGSASTVDRRAAAPRRRARPSRPSAATVAASWRYAERRARERGATPALEPRRRRRRASAPGARASAASRAPGRATSEREAVRVDQPERRPRRASRRSSAATPSGVSGPASTTSNAPASAVAEVDVGGEPSTSRWIGATQSCVVGELDDEAS